jgi:hypothetical protein
MTTIPGSIYCSCKKKERKRNENPEKRNFFHIFFYNYQQRTTISYNWSNFEWKVRIFRFKR